MGGDTAKRERRGPHGGDLVRGGGGKHGGANRGGNREEIANRGL